MHWSQQKEIDNIIDYFIKLMVDLKQGSNSITRANSLFRLNFLRWTRQEKVTKKKENEIGYSFGWRTQIFTWLLDENQLELSNLFKFLCYKHIPPSLGKESNASWICQQVQVFITYYSDDFQAELLKK